MPSFDTPGPITATAHVDAGSIQFIAGDRTDTVVETRPRDPKKDQDVRSAGQTEVAYANGALTIRTPKQRYLVGRTGTVDVTVELPAGSHVEMTGAWAQVLGEGRLGEVRVKTSSGGGGGGGRWGRGGAWSGRGSGPGSCCAWAPRASSSDRPVRR
ncbi:hypothetical protein ACFV4U_26315, partial [Streptomyces sp. NPDC059783]